MKNMKHDTPMKNETTINYSTNQPIFKITWGIII